MTFNTSAPATRKPRGADNRGSMDVYEDQLDELKLILAKLDEILRKVTP